MRPANLPSFSADAAPSALRAHADVRALDASGCRRPSDALRAALRAAAPLGSMLLESRDPRGPAGRCSLLVTRPRLRLQVRGSAVLLRAADALSEPLLDAFAARLPDAARRGRTLRATLAPVPSAERCEHDRLREPCVLDLVRALTGLIADARPAPFPIALHGSFGFELVERFDALPALPTAEHEDDNEADLDLLLGLDLVRYDHGARRVEVVTRALQGPGLDAAAERTAAREREQELLEQVRGAPLARRRGTGSSAETDRPATDSERLFLRGAERILEHVRAGDVFQCVLSRRFSLASAAEPLDVYDALLARDPSPYHFFLERGSSRFFGASPEPFLEVEGRRAAVRPIAGTVARGRGADGALDPELDGRLALQLAADPKEQAEHAMLVDLARNDLARVCVPGTRRAHLPPALVRLADVQHLASRVTGTLREGLDALHAYRACANAGTVSGAPRLRATELLRELEGRRRGSYGGAVGFVARDGRLATAIAIRSLRHARGRYVAQAGAGIVLESDPERELAETASKARAALRAVRDAERGATSAAERGVGA